MRNVIASVLQVAGVVILAVVVWSLSPLVVVGVAVLVAGVFLAPDL